MELFKKRKYKITFEKTIQWESKYNYDWFEVTDSFIACILLKLQETYNFEIIKVILRDSCNKSKIIIKCDKQDKNNIFFNFCKLLSGKIENTSIH